MRVLNLFVLATILIGGAISFGCLYAVHVRNPVMDSMACPLLGPGIMVLGAGTLAAFFVFAIGVAIRLRDEHTRLWPSLYALNLGLALVLPLGLLL